MIEGRMFYICVRSMSHFFITKSRFLKIRYHVPTTVEPGKESLTSTLESQQLDGQMDHVVALGSSVISCITLGVRSPVALIHEFPWVVTPEACLGELFLVYDVLAKMQPSSILCHLSRYTLTYTTDLNCYRK